MRRQNPGQSTSGMLAKTPRVHGVALFERQDKYINSTPSSFMGIYQKDLASNMPRPEEFQGFNLALEGFKLRRLVSGLRTS